MLKLNKLLMVTSLIVAGLVLTAFSVSTPFVYPQGKEIKASKAKLVVTHATIRAGQSTPFYDRSEEVVKSLKDQPGLLAYSIRRQLFGNQAWTLTLWDSEHSKSAFTRSSAHQSAMAEASSVLSCARFLRVDWSGEVKNLDWEEVLGRLDTESVSYRFGNSDC
jgi:heme-degrading monooxygenase HmoA